jgi:hypothetical protein
MDDAEVPQEGNATHAGLRKAVYAKGPDGTVRLVTSAGWEVEQIVTRQVLDLLATQAEDARARALQGTASPLEYHMYRAKMDLPLLAQSTGIWQWRVKRHFRPAIFGRLSIQLLQRYADALGVSLEALRDVKP